MKWSHLPVPGGIYAQHPQLLDEWAIIFNLVSEKQEAELREQQNKSRNAKAKNR